MVFGSMADEELQVRGFGLEDIISYTWPFFRTLFSLSLDSMVSLDRLVASTP